MVITEKLKQRFVKDTGLPIKIFEEPYFSHYLNLYEEHFQAMTKWRQFQELLTHFANEQDYFEEYNRIKDAAIRYFEENSAMQYFCQKEDMNKFKCCNTGYPGNGIFKETNVGKHFVSIDMIKANFTALRHYDPEIVGGVETYEDFIGMFTQYDYIKKSKYIRQVIFGNQNPKRQTTYEKYLMNQILTDIFYYTQISPTKVAYFGTDEIVLDISDYVTDDEDDNNDAISAFMKNLNVALDKNREKGINVRNEYFKLYRIKGTAGYLKVFTFTSCGKNHDFKCLDALEMPFVIRYLNDEAYTEEDMVFVYEGRMARFLEGLTVEITDIPIC